MELLNQHDKIHEDIQKRSPTFDRVVGIVVDLYIDKYKMVGKNVKSRVSGLLSLLHDEYSFDKLLAFFASN